MRGVIPPPLAVRMEVLWNLKIMVKKLKVYNMKHKETKLGPGSGDIIKPGDTGGI